METLENLFKAVGDKNRLRILMLLARKKMCVCELSYVLKITQPSVSKHLKKLKKAGIIGSEQDGFWTNYYVSKDLGPEATLLLEQIQKWLRADKQAASDLKTAQKANRERLCCK